jgi:hypothetical protein
MKRLQNKQATCPELGFAEHAKDLLRLEVITTALIKTVF